MFARSALRGRDPHGLRPGGGAGLDEPLLGRDLTVLLISESEQEVREVRRLLPGRLVHSLVRRRSVVGAGRLLEQRAEPVCVLVGHPPAGHTSAEVVGHVQRRAPHAAVVVLTGAPAAPGLGLPAGTVQDHVDTRGADPEAFVRTLRLALRRKHGESTGAATEADVLLVRENASLERGLLHTPALRGDGFTAASCYRPGRAHTLLSGDFFDVVRTEDSSVHAMVGDVSGHGAAEAALGVHLRMAWRTAVLCGRTQLDQMRMLERILDEERQDDDTYATVVSLVFPPGGRSVRVVSAGHPGFLLRRSREVRWVEPRAGIPLGLFPGRADWAGTEMELLPHDSVVLLTDGLFEGRAGASTRLGEEGLLRLASRCSHLAAQEFVDALVAGVASLAAPHGGLTDDIAVLHLGWNPTRPPLHPRT